MKQQRFNFAKDFEFFARLASRQVKIKFNQTPKKCSTEHIASRQLKNSYGLNTYLLTWSEFLVQVEWDFEGE